MQMPAEWEKHAATLLAWPHHEKDWPGKFQPIPWVYGEIIRHLTAHEPVKLLVQDAQEKKNATAILKRAGVNLKNIDFRTIPTDRVWLRDSGPIYVKAGKEKMMLDWKFTAWAKYPNHKRDIKIPALLAAYPSPRRGEARRGAYGYSGRRMPPSPTLPPAGGGRIERIKPMHKGKRVVLEGGSIDVNGEGVLLTTEECLLSDIQCRNPGFKRSDYEAVFAKYLGIEQVIWLGKGIEGDDTHGHVDDLARFVSPDTIVTVVEKNKKDVNHAPLADNLKRLKKARNRHGKPFNIVELPMPKPLIFEGTRLPASYANFYIANGLVLVPTFNDPADRTALSLLAELFPKRDIVGIHAVDLVWGFGTLHCMSQQEPL